MCCDRKSPGCFGRGWGHLALASRAGKSSQRRRCMSQVTQNELDRALSRGKNMWEDREGEMQSLQRTVFRAMWLKWQSGGVWWGKASGKGRVLADIWSRAIGGSSGLGMSCSIQKEIQWKEQIVCRGRANIYWTRTESQDQRGEQKEQRCWKLGRGGWIQWADMGNMWGEELVKDQELETPVICFPQILAQNRFILHSSGRKVREVSDLQTPGSGEQDQNQVARTYDETSSSCSQ